MKAIEEIRKDIDVIDDEVISLLEKRFNLVIKMPKQKDNLTDIKRENQILNKTSSTYVKEVYRMIFSQSKRLMHEKLTLEKLLK